ncbi:hypothetical protein CB1_000548034 [Camelus ferus]|nr:hypothetical protein CB1_000548034 [Camelus ferus]
MNYSRAGNAAPSIGPGPLLPCTAPALRPCGPCIVVSCRLTPVPPGECLCPVLRRTQHWCSGTPQLPCAKALYNYEGKEPGDLKFSKGDIIILRRQVDENWYHGEVNGVHGFFPTNFVQIIKPLPQPPPQCKALYDFEVKDKEADKDCLPFAKDDVLTVIRRVDVNWAEGMLADRIGIFPISYVESMSGREDWGSLVLITDTLRSGESLVRATEAVPSVLFGRDPPDLSTLGSELRPWLHWGVAGCSWGVTPFNSAAKQLIEWDQPPGPGTGAGEGPSATAPKQPDAKKNTRKRHSFTSLTTAGKSTHAGQQRHSMDISPPVLISSSNPAAAARIGELAGLSCSAPSQERSAPHCTAPGALQRLQLLCGKVQLQSRESKQSMCNSCSASGALFCCRCCAPELCTDRPTVNPPLPPPPLQAATPAGAAVGTGTRPAAGPTDQTAHLRPQTRPSVYVAVYPYTPRKEDELELRKGEMFLVFERCQDGWFKGTSMHTSKTGVFPGNYVAPVTRTVTSASQGGPAQQLQGNGVAGGPGVVPTAVVSAAHLQTSPPAKVLMHMSGQMTVSQARSVVRTEELLLLRASERSDHGTDRCRRSRVPMLIRQGAWRAERQSGGRHPGSAGRHRVVVSYPPQSEAELELKEGDIVFVHKKREDGWFKGTLQRNGKTGLFPGSFVENI